MNSNLAEAVLSTSVDAVIVIHSSGNISLFNDAAGKLFGYSVQEVIDKNVKMLMPPPYNIEHDGYLRNYANTGVKKVIGIGRTVKGLRKDGSIFPMELSVSEFMDGNNQMFAAIIRDITSSDHSKQMEQIMLNIMKTTIDPIIVITQNGTVFLFNDASEKLFGYSREQVVGKNVKMLMPLQYSRDHDQYLTNYITTRVKKIIGIGRMVAGKRKDGTEFPLNLSVSEQVSVDGSLLFTAILRDMTEIDKEKQRQQVITSILQTTVDSIICIDNVGTINIFNDAAERVFGYSSEEVLGNNVRMLMPDPYSSEHDQYLLNYRQTNVKKIIGLGRTIPAMRKDGKQFPCELSVSEYKNRTGESYFTGILRDLSKEESARENELIMTTVLSTSVDAVIVIKTTGRITLFNIAAEKMFGYDLSEVQDHNVRILMPEPFKSEHDAYLSNYLTTGIKKIIGIGRTVEGRHKSGRCFPIELSISEFATGSGTRYFAAIIRDITVSQNLRQTEQIMSTVLRTTVDAVIVIDTEGLIEMFNQAAEKMFRLSEGQVMGQNVHMLMPEPYKSEHNGYLANYLRTGDRKIIGIGRKVRGLRSDGSVFPISLAVSEFKTKAGRRFFTAIIRDTTDEDSNNDRLRTIESMVSNANDMLASIELPSNNFIFMNRAFRRLLSINDERSKTIGDILTVEDCKKFIEDIIPNCRDRTRPWTGELNVRSVSTDESIVVEASIFTIILPGGGHGAGLAMKDLRDKKRLEKLRAKSDRNRTIMETIVNGCEDFMCVINEDLSVKFINDAGRKMCGFVKDATPRHSDELCPPASLELLRSNIVPLVIAKGKYVGEIVLLNSDTSEHTPAEVQAFSIRYSNDTSVSIALICRDIREKRREDTRRRLAEKEKAQIEAIVNNCDDIVAMIDVQTKRFLFLNNAGMKLLGVDKSVTRQHLFIDDVFPLISVKKIIDEVLPIGEAVISARNQPSKESLTSPAKGYWTGDLLFQSVTSKEIHYTVGGAFSVHTAGSDSTTGGNVGMIFRIIRNKNLLTFEELSINHGDDAIVICDPNDYSIVYTNQNYRTLTGYSQAELLGKNPRFLQRGSADQEQLRVLKAALKAEKPITVTLNNYHKDGSMFLNQLTIRPVRIEKDNQFYYFGIAKDVTSSSALLAILCKINQAFATANIGLILFGLKGSTIHYANEIIMEEYGRKGDALVKLGTMIRDHDECIARLKDASSTSSSFIHPVTHQSTLAMYFKYEYEDADSVLLLLLDNTYYNSITAQNNAIHEKTSLMLSRLVSEALGSISKSADIASQGTSSPGTALTFNGISSVSSILSTVIEKRMFQLSSASVAEVSPPVAVDIQTLTRDLLQTASAQIFELGICLSLSIANGTPWSVHTVASLFATVLMNAVLQSAQLCQSPYLSVEVSSKTSSNSNNQSIVSCDFEIFSRDLIGNSGKFRAIDLSSEDYCVFNDISHAAELFGAKFTVGKEHKDPICTLTISCTESRCKLGENPLFSSQRGKLNDLNVGVLCFNASEAKYISSLSSKWGMKSVICKDAAELMSAIKAPVNVLIIEESLNRSVGNPVDIILEAHEAGFKGSIIVLGSSGKQLLATGSKFSSLLRSPVSDNALFLALQKSKTEIDEAKTAEEKLKQVESSNRQRQDAMLATQSRAFVEKQAAAVMKARIQTLVPAAIVGIVLALWKFKKGG